MMLSFKSFDLVHNIAAMNACWITATSRSGFYEPDVNASEQTGRVLHKPRRVELRYNWRFVNFNIVVKVYDGRGHAGVTGGVTPGSRALIVVTDVVREKKQQTGIDGRFALCCSIHSLPTDGRVGESAPGSHAVVSLNKLSHMIRASLTISLL